MDEGNRYYWLKLDRNFFKRHDIRIIEAMPNGKDYILFYLKLLCESVDHMGNLRFSENIPYNPEMLSTITNTNIDIVRAAVKIFSELEMMEVLDNGTFFMTEVLNMIGSAANNDNANRQRRFRERQKQGLLRERYDDVTENNESKSKSKSKSKNQSKSKEKEEDILYHSEEKIAGADNKDGEFRFDETASDNNPAFATPDDFEKQFAKKLISAWNETGGPKVKGFLFNSVRGENYLTLLRAYGGETILAAVEKAKNSEFLHGGNDRGWVATFDWFLRPDNFAKVLEGNYDEQFTPGSGWDGGFSERADGYGKAKAGRARGCAEPTERELRGQRQRAAREHFPEIRGADLDGDD